MRLIKADTTQIHEFLDVENAPAFAILSHTWSDQECTLQDMEDPSVKSRTGYANGLDWAWVDTCCIDKTNSAELSEAINSMFRWYRTAAKCYVYFSDVNDLSDLERSRWFTRGWTLQELVAPKEVSFYSSDWILLGTKLEMADKISQITNIDVDVLKSGIFNHISIAARMSWAANRQTTRTEDMAYSLLGIFNVNMPLLYGEREKSFKRLQEEIIKFSDDSSIFAWGIPANIRTGSHFFASQDCVDRSKLHDPFAESPVDFSLCHQLKPLRNRMAQCNSMVTKSGVELTLPIWTSGPYLAAALPFTLKGKNDYCLCIPLMWWDKRSVARWAEPILVLDSGQSSKANGLGQWEGLQRLPISSPTSVPMQPPSFDVSGIQNLADDLSYDLDVHCLPHAQYSAKEGNITISEMKEGSLAALFFKRSLKSPHPATWSSNAQLLEEADRYIKKHGGFFKHFNGPDVIVRSSRFAVVLGRDSADSSDSCWLKVFQILEENTPDDDFHSLLRTDAELVRYCMTKSHMISALRDEKVQGSLLWDSDKRLRYTGFMERRLERFNLEMDHSHPASRRRIHQLHFKNIQDVFVDIELQTKWKNLPERKIFLSMKIHTKEKRWQEPVWYWLPHPK